MTPSKVTCPLCGKSNACGMANGGTSCWCFEMTIAAETLEKIPEADRSVVCICKACASGAGSVEVEAAPELEVLAKRSSAVEP